MTVVIDANVLLRFVDTMAGQHPQAVAAVSALHAQGQSLRTLPQSIYEFWSVATRPVAGNGLGLSITECEQTVTKIEALFPMLADPPGLFAEWRAIVAAYACHGKVSHDARYVAAMRALSVAHIMTFNGADFARFPGLTVIDPANVTPAPASPSAPNPATPPP